MIYGHARVSTDGQSVDALVQQLGAAAAEKIFRETASGASSDRDYVDCGDTIHISSTLAVARFWPRPSSRRLRPSFASSIAMNSGVPGQGAR